ncbi:flagellar hook protein FlgE [Clostridia bacterium]|nr:flagellar hook protein FlgE [Clostridia bacterium]
MMRSMFSGVSGLRIHQTKMDVIANNISNVNTNGFKSSRVTFAEIFAQTTSGASGANAATGKGGVNPMQIGLGGTVASIDLSMTQGAAQRTDNPYDLMIQGDGFFIVGDGSGTYFTRAGAFSLDAEGNFVNPSGMRLQGWDRVWDNVNKEWKIQRGMVQGLTLTPEKQSSPPQATTKVEFENNLNGTTTQEHVSTISFYDSLGNRYTTQVVFDNPSATAPGVSTTWDMHLYNDGSTGIPAGANNGYMWADGTDPSKPENRIPLVATGVLATLTFDSNGVLDATAANGGVVGTTTGAVVTAGLAQAVIQIEPVPGAGSVPMLPPAATFGQDGSGEILLDFKNITQFGNEVTNAKSDTVDGHGPGNLTGVSIGADGKIMGRYTNGMLEVLGQVAVARFDNPQGLEKAGDNLYVTTINSGDFDGIGEEVQADGSKIMGGVLEMANVDLAQEFTEMITTQRGFQANSRTITTSDEMLQELVRLK